VNREPSLTRRLTLEEREDVADGSGGFSTMWRPLGSLWAEMTAKTGREDFIAGQTRPRVKYLILTRAAMTGAPSRPRPEQRFREGDRIFNILTVAESDPQGRYLEIYAEEGILP
jgi:SPP1 family predicted phage head-tail adaptor